MTGRCRSLAAGLFCLAAAMPCRAQEPTTSPSLPDLGEVSGLLNKASQSPDGKAGDWSGPVRLAVVFALLALLPSLLVMMTSFTRIVIVLGFLRRALTTQSIPPNIAIIGLALFLTLFTMSPTLGRIHQDAIQPYMQNTLPAQAALAKTGDHLREFMLRQTRQADLALFAEMGHIKAPAQGRDLPLWVVTPAFAISEFRTAFEMGCLLFIPFLLVDLVISSILLSAGMMMLPPVIISLPFKIILFVLVDGWRLLAAALAGSFH